MSRKQSHNPFSPMNAVMGMAGIFLGIIVGYVIGAAQSPSMSAAAVVPNDDVHTTQGALVDENELRAYRDILARDPRNLNANVELGNKLYDAGRFAEAIPYYQQALTIEPDNVNVSTDLGTAMYYAGRNDEALAQLQKSLTIDPSHGQTLFNIGIIRRDGKKDVKGAVEAWEQLLRVAPNYPDAERVRSLIAQAK